MIWIAFDVDGTLSCSGGPIPVARVEDLADLTTTFRVGLCGNANLVRDHEPALWGLMDFTEHAFPDEKTDALFRISRGAAFDDPLFLFIGDALTDKVAADAAGWTYIHPRDFR